MKAGKSKKKNNNNTSDLPKVKTTVEEIKREQGKLVAAFALANEKQRMALFAAFTTLGWVLSGGDNPVRVAIERTKWDEAREKQGKEE